MIRGQSLKVTKVTKGRGEWAQSVEIKNGRGLGGRALGVLARSERYFWRLRARAAAAAFSAEAWTCVVAIAEEELGGL